MPNSARGPNSAKHSNPAPPRQLLRETSLRRPSHKRKKKTPPCSASSPASNKMHEAARSRRLMVKSKSSASHARSDARMSITERNARVASSRCGFRPRPANPERHYTLLHVKRRLRQFIRHSHCICARHDIQYSSMNQASPDCSTSLEAPTARVCGLMTQGNQLWHSLGELPNLTAASWCLCRDSSGCAAV